MLMGSAVDWTQVLIALIAGLPAILGAVFSYLVVVRTRTPSGDTIGKVVERTHDLSSADLALTTKVHKIVKNGQITPAEDPSGG